MTRGEQIEQAARALAVTKVDKRAYYQCLFDFEMGVEWADEHPDIDVRTMAAWQSGYQAAIDTHPHWISVEDELPKTETEVLMVSSGCADTLCGYRCKVGKNRWYCYNDDEYWHNITHWMPMPQPPILSKSENIGKKGGEQIIGTADHIKIALDVIDKKGGEQ